MTATPLDGKKEIHPIEASLNESLDGLCMELSRISAEILSINSGFQDQMQQALDDLRENLEKQYQDRLKQALDFIPTAISASRESSARFTTMPQGAIARRSASRTTCGRGAPYGGLRARRAA